MGPHQPPAMFATLARYVQIGDTASLSRFRDAPVVVENLPPMSEHVRRGAAGVPHPPALRSVQGACGRTRRWRSVSAAASRGGTFAGAHQTAALARPLGRNDRRRRTVQRLPRTLHRHRSGQNARLRRDGAATLVRTRDRDSVAFTALPGPLLDFAEAAQSPVSRAGPSNARQRSLRTQRLPNGNGRSHWAGWPGWTAISPSPQNSCHRQCPHARGCGAAGITPARCTRMVRPTQPAGNCRSPASSHRKTAC